MLLSPETDHLTKIWNRQTYIQPVKQNARCCLTVKTVYQDHNEVGQRRRRRLWPSSEGPPLVARIFPPQQESHPAHITTNPSTRLCKKLTNLVSFCAIKLCRKKVHSCKQNNNNNNMHNFSWQRLAGEQRFAQPIRGKGCSYISGFLWQFSVSMLYVWPTRWLFLSPRRNHSRHRSTLR